MEAAAVLQTQIAAASIDLIGPPVDAVLYLIDGRLADGSPDRMIRDWRRPSAHRWAFMGGGNRLQHLVESQFVTNLKRLVTDIIDRWPPLCH